MKLLTKLALKFLVKELNQIPDVTEEEKEDGYALLFDNVKMMKNLEKISISDTKSMMTTDARKDDWQRGYRYGAFIRTRALIKNAQRFHNEREAKKK